MNKANVSSARQSGLGPAWRLPHRTKLRVILLVVPLVIIGTTVVLAAEAAFGPNSHTGNLGANYSSGAHFLRPTRDTSQTVRSTAAGHINDVATGLDWTTDAFDTGVWVGAISDADPPKWVVNMKTNQAVQVYGVSNFGGNFSAYNPSDHYRAEAFHLGWGMANGVVVVKDGAHLHVGSGENSTSEVRWYSVSDTQQISYLYKKEPSGEYDNLQHDENGDLAYDEAEMTLMSPTVLCSLNNKTITARLRHVVFKPWGSPAYGHQVWLRVNEQFSHNDPGWIVSWAKAYNEGTDELLGTWEFK